MANHMTEVVRNSVYSEIILAINEGNKTSTELAEILKKDQSPISRQLRYLQKKKFLILEEDKKQFNKKVYSVNWLKINEEFFNSLKYKNKEIDQNLFNNKIFTKILQKVFYNYQKRDDITLWDIFNEIKGVISVLANIFSELHGGKPFLITGDKEIDGFNKITYLLGRTSKNLEVLQTIMEYSVEWKKLDEEL